MHDFLSFTVFFAIALLFFISNICLMAHFVRYFAVWSPPNISSFWLGFISPHDVAIAAKRFVLICILRGWQRKTKHPHVYLDNLIQHALVSYCHVTIKRFSIAFYTVQWVCQFLRFLYLLRKATLLNPTNRNSPALFVLAISHCFIFKRKFLIGGVVS